MTTNSTSDYDTFLSTFNVEDLAHSWPGTSRAA
jgi:hypothetical protein